MFFLTISLAVSSLRLGNSLWNGLIDSSKTLASARDNNGFPSTESTINAFYRKGSLFNMKRPYVL